MKTEIKTNTDEPFGSVIDVYTRKQAVADGLQIEVSETARKAGIAFRVFLTQSVFDSFVTVPPSLKGQDEAGRLWDIVWMLGLAIRRSLLGVNCVTFELSVKNNTRAPQLVKLVAICGPLDIDDAQPAITVMMPDED